MMAKVQKKYTPEFKQQIFDLYNAGGKSFPKLESEYGAYRSTISGWVKELSPIKVSDTEKISIKELVTFINSNIHLYTVSQLCKALKFTRITYYNELISVPSNKQLEYNTFSEKVKTEYFKFKQRYGAIKLQKVLKAT